MVTWHLTPPFFFHLLVSSLQCLWVGTGNDMGCPLGIFIFLVVIFFKKKKSSLKLHIFFSHVKFPPFLPCFVFWRAFFIFLFFSSGDVGACRCRLSRLFVFGPAGFIGGEVEQREPASAAEFRLTQQKTRKQHRHPDSPTPSSLTLMTSDPPHQPTASPPAPALPAV